MTAQATDPTADQLIATCMGDVTHGVPGWHYVRTCCGVLTAGWWPDPLPLSGLLWAAFVPGDFPADDLTAQEVCQLELFV